MNIEKIIFENEGSFLRHFINSSNLRNYEKMSDNEKKSYHQKIFKLNVEKKFLLNLRNYAGCEVYEPITYEKLGMSLISIKRMCNLFYEKKYYLKNNESVSPENITNVLNNKIVANLSEFESCFAKTTGFVYFNEYRNNNKKEIIEKALKEQIPYDFIKLLTKFTNKEFLKDLFYYSIKDKDNVEQLTYEDIRIYSKTLEKIFEYKINEELKETKEEKFLLISEMLDKMYDEKTNQQEYIK